MTGSRGLEPETLGVPSEASLRSVPSADLEGSNFPESSPEPNTQSRNFPYAFTEHNSLQFKEYQLAESRFKLAKAKSTFSVDLFKKQKSLIPGRSEPTHVSDNRGKVLTRIRFSNSVLAKAYLDPPECVWDEHALKARLARAYAEELAMANAQVEACADKKLWLKEVLSQIQKLTEVSEYLTDPHTGRVLLEALRATRELISCQVEHLNTLDLEGAYQDLAIRIGASYPWAEPLSLSMAPLMVQFERAKDLVQQLLMQAVELPELKIKYEAAAAIIALISDIAKRQFEPKVDEILLLVQMLLLLKAVVGPKKAQQHKPSALKLFTEAERYPWCRELELAFSHLNRQFLDSHQLIMTDLESLKKEHSLSGHAIALINETQTLETQRVNHPQTEITVQYRMRRADLASSLSLHSGAGARRLSSELVPLDVQAARASAKLTGSIALLGPENSLLKAVASTFQSQLDQLAMLYSQAKDSLAITEMRWHCVHLIQNHLAKGKPASSPADPTLMSELDLQRDQRLIKRHLQDLSWHQQGLALIMTLDHRNLNFNPLAELAALRQELGEHELQGKKVIADLISYLKRVKDNAEVEDLTFKAELVSSLAMYCPPAFRHKACALADRLLPCEDQYRLANAAMVEAISEAHLYDFQINSARNLVRAAHQIKAKGTTPAESKANLQAATEMLFWGRREIYFHSRSADEQKHHRAYTEVLCKNISHYPWAKIAKFAMLALIGAATLAFCCTGYGLVAVPVIAWSMAAIAPTMIASLTASVTGLWGMFSQAVSRPRAEIEDLQDAMKTKPLSARPA